MNYSAAKNIYMCCEKNIYVSSYKGWKVCFDPFKKSFQQSGGLSFKTWIIVYVPNVFWEKVKFFWPAKDEGALTSW